MMSVNSALLHDTYHLSDKPSDEDWEKLNKRIVRLAVSSEILQRKMIRVTMGWVGLDWIGLEWIDHCFYSLKGTRRRLPFRIRSV